MVKEVLPDDGWPPVSTTASSEPSKVYELNFKILNFKSCTILQTDLWFLYILRLNSLFASKAHVRWTLSLKNLTGCLLSCRHLRAHGRHSLSKKLLLIFSRNFLELLRIVFFLQFSSIDCNYYVMIWSAVLRNSGKNIFSALSMSEQLADWSFLFASPPLKSSWESVKIINIELLIKWKKEKSIGEKSNSKIVKST